MLPRRPSRSSSDCYDPLSPRDAAVRDPYLRSDPARDSCPRWRVSVDFGADGERDTFGWTGEAADEQLAFEAAFDAITEEFGPPDEVYEVRTERLA